MGWRAPGRSFHEFWQWVQAVLIFLLSQVLKVLLSRTIRIAMTKCEPLVLTSSKVLRVEKLRQNSRTQIYHIRICPIVKIQVDVKLYQALLSRIYLAVLAVD